MRTAFFCDFTESAEQEKLWCDEVRRRTEADELMAIMSGDYLQNGLPALEDKKTRARKGIEAGADAVFEMSLYASLSSIGIFAFSAARMIDKLKCVDSLVLETNMSKEMIEKIVFLLIANTRSFQQKVTAYKLKGMTFYAAQAKALGEEVDGAEECMLDWTNILAVETAKSLKIMYSPIQCIYVPKRIFSEGTVTKVSRRLGDFVQYQTYVQETKLSDIYGGYEELTNRIMACRDVFSDFNSFVADVAGTDKDVYDVRKYFLRLLCGLKKSRVTVWRMYDFVPYCVLHTKERELFERLAASKRLPLMDSEGNGYLEEQSKRELYAFEKMAEKIYRLL